MKAEMLLALVLFVSLASEDFNAEGRKALEAQNYTLAVEQFTKAVAADEKDYTARFHLALALSLLERYAEAIPEYQKVLELKPGLYQAQLNLGMLLLREKKAAEAAPLLEAAAAQKPGEYRPQFYAGEALLASGDHTKAEPHYRAAVAADPKSAAAELGLARSLAGLSRLAEAEEHFRKAAELDPAFTDSLLELASLLDKAEETDKAIALYDRFPDDPGARERAIALLIRAKRQAEAAPRIAKALERDPKNYELRMLNGRVLRDERKFIPAAQQFWAAAQIRPDSRESWNEMAGVLIMAENYPQALAALDRARALGEDTPANHFFRALVLDRTRQYRPALESYQRFLDLSQGKNPDEEFKARQRIKVINKELSKR